MAAPNRAVIAGGIKKGPRNQETKKPGDLPRPPSSTLGNRDSAVSGNAGSLLPDAQGDARMDLVSLAHNPVPGGATAGLLTSFDGVRLRFARWNATRGPRRGTVCLFGGRGEFIEKYFEVIADLRRRGYAVAMHDWRGQGGSARMLPNPRKGYVRNFREYDADLTRFMKDVVLPDCPPPYIALAHSMGANILLRNATIQGSWFDRMILTAPMLALADEKVPAPHALAQLYAGALGWGALGHMYVLGGSNIAEETKPFEGEF